MKKLLIITKTLSTNDGQGRYSLDMIRLLKNNYQLVVFCFQEPENREVDVIYRQLGNLFFSWQFFKEIRTADLIHCFSDYPYCLILLLCFYRKPIFVTAHGTYSVLPLDKPIGRFLLKLVYKKVRKIFCVSSFTQKEILTRIRLDNTTIINNGVDYDKFQISCRKQDKEKIILSVGALKPRKGYHISIPAVARVKDNYPNIKYYIIGGNPEKHYLDMIKNYNLENNVKFFCGVSDEDLIGLYYECDIFLLTSVTKDNNDFEGFGLVYLEAGACGKPVIGAFGSGAEDAIVNEETGILIPQNDIQATAETILKLLNNPDFARRLGENGKKRAQQMNWGSVIKKYIEVYENSLSFR